MMGLEMTITQGSEQWYTSLIDELQDIITETGFTSRWTLIEGYHAVGVRILQENNNFERSQIYGENIVQRIAQSLGKSKRTLSYAIQFAKAYPDLNLLPDGKNISWYHVVNKYLSPEKKEPPEPRLDKKKLDLLIGEIMKLLEVEVLKARQLQVSFGTKPEAEIYKDRITFIRYLQDQVNKIVGG